MAGAAAGRVMNHCGEAITVREVLGKDKSKLLFHRVTAITSAYLSSRDTVEFVRQILHSPNRSNCGAFARVRVSYTS